MSWEEPQPHGFGIGLLLPRPRARGEREDMDSEKLAGATANIAARIQKDEEKWRIVLRLIDIDGKTRAWSSTRNKEEIGDQEV